MEKPTCRWPGCPLEVRARGLCPTHYERARGVGDFQDPWRHWSPMECAECGVAFAPARRGQAAICSAACRLAVWKRENPERDAASQRRWREANRDAVLKKVREWNAAHPDARRERGRRHSAKRRAQQMGRVSEPFTVADVRMRTGDDCYLCGERINFKIRHPDPRSASLDHVIPLSRGGDHVLENAAMTHLSCNVRKNASIPDSFPAITLLAS